MLYFLIFILGLSVGSFLNVVICRLEIKESVVANRSHCPQCGAVLKWYDLIPLLSFVFLLGKCRSCGKKISWQYPAVEIATGLLFLFVMLDIMLDIGGLTRIVRPPMSNMADLCVICFLIIIFVYDLRHYIIPDKIIFPAIILSFLFSIFAGNFLNFLLAALGASLFFLFLVLVSKGKWMGMGDVKLAFLMGLVLGWPNILAALFLAFLSGAVVGVALIIFGKKGLKSQIPFGPFLAGATIAIMLCGQCSVDWIERFFF